MTKKLKGQKIVSARTIGSMYDHNCIRVYDKAGNEYRIDVDELLKVFDSVSFNIEKKRVHTYLWIEEIDKPDFEKAFGILMEYWDSMPEDEQTSIDKRLKECGV